MAVWPLLQKTLCPQLVAAVAARRGRKRHAFFSGTGFHGLVMYFAC